MKVKVEEALEGLVAKGLVKKYIVNGVPEYGVTVEGLRALKDMTEFKRGK